MKKDEDIEILENIYDSLWAEDWKKSVVEQMHPYARLSDVVRTMNLLIKKNGLYEAKKYMEIQINNAKGLTEQKCFKRKVRADYCKHCVNSFCNLNKTKKDEKFVH